MLICLFTVLKQLPHWKCLFSISSKKSSYKINKCLLLLPTIWLLVCIEVRKLKPREINIFSRSSNRQKWWNLWCPKRCQSPWVWEYVSASARWCDSSETAAQILPVHLGGAALSGASTVSPEMCLHSLFSPKVFQHPDLPCWPPSMHRGLCSSAGWSWAGLQLLSLLLGKQAPQVCLARSISSPKSVPPVLAGPTLPAVSAQAGCGGWGALPLMLSNMWLPKPEGYALLMVLLAQCVPSKSMTLKTLLCSSQILNWLVTLPPSLLLLFLESKITLRPWM